MIKASLRALTAIEKVTSKNWLRVLHDDSLNAFATIALSTCS